VKKHTLRKKIHIPNFDPIGKHWKAWFDWPLEELVVIALELKPVVFEYPLQLLILLIAECSDFKSGSILFDPQHRGVEQLSCLQVGADCEQIRLNTISRSESLNENYRLEPILIEHQRVTGLIGTPDRF
jgi:hypothetical protein